MPFAISFLGLIVGVPALNAWGTKKLLGVRSGTDWLVIAAAALIPNLWIFYATQQADGITRAASFVVVPFLFLFSLIPASIGLFLAKRRRPK